jgi:hypothetical protein
MRLPPPLLLTLAALPLRATEPSSPIAGLDTQAAEIVPIPDRNDTVLPLDIPGYELRTLEARRHLLLDVEGTQLKASLPVFFYFPKPASPEAAALVHRACDDLVRLGAQPEWTGAELQAVIASLEAAVRLLDPAPPAASARPRA